MEKSPASLTQAFSQGVAIARKNLHNHLSAKKKLIGELLMPLIVSAAYVATQKTKADNPFLSILLMMLLKMYLGLIGSSAVREVVTLFITERTQHFRQYQMIFGVSQRTHTLSNLLYICAYQSFFLLPLFGTIAYYHLDFALVFRFGVFVLSTCTLSLALTAFFRDHKIAVEVTGLLFSMAAFLPFAYDSSSGNSPLNVLIMALPNSSFTIAILDNTSTPSLFSLAFVKLYLMIYSFAQFPEYYKSLCKNCCRKLSSYLPFDRQPTNLMEEFELNEVVNSDLQHSLNQQLPFAVRIEALTKTYKVKDCKINALNAISLKIYQSQIFGLLGRNGAGKTTLVDILTGVTEPSQGSFHLTTPSIGICYQHQVLYEELTVDQHLLFYASIKPFVPPGGETLQDHIEDTIRMMGIESERSKRAKELSGGNKRKLSIAIAILGRPGLLIFDEPTSGLDPLSRINVWEVFASLRRTRSTIILTTHHLDQAERLTDWICVIEKGSVIVENTAAQIKEKYGKGFHLQLCLREGNLSYSDIEKYKGMVEKGKLKAVELQHLPAQANLLVKPLEKDTSTIEFEKQFAGLVAELEKDGTVEARFHSNTLEESFIAILKDQENSSGDSLSEQPLPRDAHSQDDVFCRWPKQVLGVVLKSLFYQKSVFTQSILIYNINILIVLTSSFFNHLFKDVATQDAKPVPSGPNPMMLLQGYAVMASAFISLPVYEKEKKIKGVLNARGLGWPAYWLGNFLFDYSIYWLNLLVMGYLVAPDEVATLGWAALGRLGVGIIFYAYCFSAVFQKVKTASIWFGVINMLLSMLVLPLLILGKNQFSFVIQCTKLVYPYYDLTLATLTQQMGNQTEALQFAGIHMQKVNGSAIFYCIIFYVVLLICLQTKPLLRIKAYCSGKNHEQMIPEKIRLDKVSKKFGDIHALQEVSYYANEQRMALLGHNGAGKSTTFGLLSAQLTADSGEVFLQGQLRHSWVGRLQSAGICYQEDALWQGMLVNEVLSLISWLVPVRNSERETKWLWESLQFDPNNNFKRVSNLSGGNKRKLCMMVALFGDPALRLLDECSTGLDPASRLAMVDTLKFSRSGTTIFTTHSMSEAEDLCTKAVIMSKGRLLQFDLIGKMRRKYFNCCWVHIQLQQTARVGVENDILREGITVSGEGTSMKLEVDKKIIKKSELLKELIFLKEKGKISNFSWVEPRLEDVYLKVTRENGDELQAQIDNLTEVI